MKRFRKSGIQRSSGFSLNVMTDDEAHEIHLGTLEILKDVGVYVQSAKAREIFASGGCNVDHNKEVVKIPHWVVEEAIASAPASFQACGRRPEDDVLLEDGRVTFTNFGEGIMFVDPFSGEHRETVKADVEKAALVIDSLDCIATYERAMCSHDKPAPVQALHNAEASLTHTSKHHWLGPVDRFQAGKIIEMCSAIVGGKGKLRQRPLLTFVTCPISPLKLPEDHCDITMTAAENGIGVNVIAMAMAGGSSPIHLAGTLVVQNSEVLATLVLNQLTQKGSPFVYASSTCPMDLRRATASVGSPETAMISAAVARLAKYYSLPCFVAGG